MLVSRQLGANFGTGVLIKGKDWVKGHPNAIKMGVSVVRLVAILGSTN